MKYLSALLFSLFIFSSASAEVIKFSPGGSMEAFVAHRKYMEDRGLPIAIDGQCMSACTLFLQGKTTCVTPRAKFYFHAAQLVSQDDIDQGRDGIVLMDDEAWHWNLPAAIWYEGLAKGWFRKVPIDPDKPDLTYKDMPKYGIRSCKPEDLK